VVSHLYVVNHPPATIFPSSCSANASIELLNPIGTQALKSVLRSPSAAKTKVQEMAIAMSAIEAQKEKIFLNVGMIS
jgi:hypothetical protein